MNYNQQEIDDIQLLNEFLSNLDYDWLYQKYFYLTNTNRTNLINSEELLDSIWNGYFGSVLFKYDNEHFQILIKQLHDNNRKN